MSTIRLGDLVALALREPDMTSLLRSHGVDVEAYLRLLEEIPEASACISTYHEFCDSYDYLLRVLASRLSERDLSVLDRHRTFVKALVMNVFRRIVSA